MKNGVRSKGGLCCMVAMGAIGAALSLDAASVPVTESWSNGNDAAGWVAYDLINEKPAPPPVVDGGSLKIKFTPQSMKRPPEEFLIRAGAGASGGSFSGNYLTNGVMAIQFRCYCDYSPEAWIILCCEQSKRWWRYSLPPLRTGVWVEVTAPVYPETLRSVNGVEGWRAFEEDLKAVSWVGVVVRRNSSMSAQTFRLDDFTLAGPGPDFSSWMAQFPSDNNERGNRNPLPAGDLDNDGSCNYDEWVAGTSAGDAEDRLKLVIESQKGAAKTGVMLRWNAKAGRVYNVWRTSDMRAGFTKISPDLPSASSEHTYEDSEANGPQFYKVQVRMGTP